MSEHLLKQDSKFSVVEKRSGQGSTTGRPVDKGFLVPDKGLTLIIVVIKKRRSVLKAREKIEALKTKRN